MAKLTKQMMEPRIECPFQLVAEHIHLRDRPTQQFSIIAQYESEYRGIVAYYRMAFNLHRFSRLKWAVERSLVTTLAAKLRISTRPDLATALWLLLNLAD